MIKIREAIVVEGRYDRNTLSQIVDAEIFETGGFGIFRDAQMMSLLRRVAMQRGLIVFTDSDGGGLVIRNRLRSAIPGEYLKHAYIPDIPGKERRKAAPGKEGLLGVEGMRPEVILDALIRAGATVEDGREAVMSDITKLDLMEFGLSGGKNSEKMRKMLQKKLDFPEKMSANALLQALRLLYDREQLKKFVSQLEET